MSVPPLHLQKQHLRAAMKARRDAMPAAQRQLESAALTSKLLALPSFQAAQTVLITLPYGSEWATWDVAQAALAAGKTVAVPRVEPDRMLSLYAVQNLQTDITPGSFGIPEPIPSHCQPVTADAIDWVLVPGLAFDGQGGRLGYGGGYYDRLLHSLRADAVLVSAAFSFQWVDQVPMAGHDVRVAIVVQP